MPEPLRVAVMEDEPLARRRLERLISEHPDLRLVASFANPRAVGETLPALDLLFLDIEMPFETGFQWLDRLPLRDLPVVVVVTAHERHALPAIRREAVDFLLKPFDDVSFGLALARARRRVAAAMATAPVQLTEANPKGSTAAMRLEVRHQGRRLMLDPASVLWIQAAGKHVRLRVGRDTWRVAGTLAAFEARLAGSGFARVHRACLVNMAHVRGRRPRAHGDAWLQLADGTELPLSRRYASAFDRHRL